jgi:hypothetical protein
MGARQRRWVDLPAEERERRQAQSQADRERARTGQTEATGSELWRRLAQSRTDREQAEIEDAIHHTIYGGDINFMDKNDW